MQELTFYIADTHTLVWFLTGNRKLNSISKQLLLNRNARIVVPVAVFEDLRKHYRHQQNKHCHFALPPPIPVFRILRKVKHVRIYPCDEQVEAEVLELEHRSTGVTCSEDLEILATFLVLHRNLTAKKQRVVYFGADGRICGFLARKGLKEHILRSH
ncbi:MAG: hypothetical protein R6X14_00225 [bacterium]